MRPTTRRPACGASASERGAGRVGQFVAFAASAAVVGCGSTDDGAITVFAAASLADAVEEIGERFTADTDVEVRLAVAGSSTLRLQLDEGAAADVFLPADPAQIDLLDVGVAGPHVTFAANDLVVVNRRGRPPVELTDFTDDDLVLGACAPQVPCGGYARLAFDLAGIDPALDTEEPDVRAVASKVAEGELDAGLVYRTDALGDERLVVTELPDDVADLIEVEYRAVVLDDAPNATDARRFVEFLTTESAGAVLVERGFDTP